MLKLACCGTHGSGKTTLTRALGERLKLQVIDVSRPTTAAKQLGYDKAADVPARHVQLFQWMGLMEQIHQERICLEHPQQVRDLRIEGTLTSEMMNLGFVSDRAVVDFLAYYIYRLPNSELTPAYAEMVHVYAHKYDAIIWLPPNVNGVEDDNRRFVEGTQEIADLVRVCFASLELTNIIKVEVDGVDARVEYVIETLKQRGLVP